MTAKQARPSLGTAAFLIAVCCVGFYFMFAAVQGDFGVFRRVEASAERTELAAERDRLRLEVTRLENLTTRLSDNYLDLDLLDERARDVLGLARGDEIIIH